MTDPDLVLLDLKDIAFYTLPRTRTVLWDHTAKDKASVLRFSSTETPTVCIKEKVLQYVSSKLQDEESEKAFGNFMGFLVIGPDSESIVIICDKYGKIPDSEGYCKELEIPALFSTKTEAIRWDLEYFYSDLKEIFSNSQNMPCLNLRGFLKIRISASLIGIHCSIKVEMATLFASFKMVPINSFSILHSQLVEAISKDERKLKCSGFLALSKDKELVHLSEKQPELTTLPLVGIWVSGVTTVLHPLVWAACVRYISDPFLHRRICLPPLPFAVVLHSPKSVQPQFFDCTYDDHVHNWPNFGYFEGCIYHDLPKVPVMDPKIISIQLKECKSESSFGAADRLIERQEIMAGPDVIVTNSDDVPLSSRHNPYMRKVISPQHCVPDLSVVWKEGSVNKLSLDSNFLLSAKDKHCIEASENVQQVFQMGAGCNDNLHNWSSCRSQFFSSSKERGDRNSKFQENYFIGNGKNLLSSAIELHCIPERISLPFHQENIEGINHVHEEYPKCPPSKTKKENLPDNEVDTCSMIPHNDTEKAVQHTPCCTKGALKSVSYNPPVSIEKEDLGSRSYLRKSCLKKASKKESDSITISGSADTCQDHKNQPVSTKPSRIPVPKVKLSVLNANARTKSNAKTSDLKKKPCSKTKNIVCPVLSANESYESLARQNENVVEHHKKKNVHSEFPTSVKAISSANELTTDLPVKSVILSHCLQGIPSIDSLQLMQNARFGGIHGKNKTSLHSQFRKERSFCSPSFEVVKSPKSLVDCAPEKSDSLNQKMEKNCKQTSSVATMTSFTAIENMKSKRNDSLRMLYAREKTIFEEENALADNITVNSQLQDDSGKGDGCILRDMSSFHEKKGHSSPFLACRQDTQEQFSLHQCSDGRKGADFLRIYNGKHSVTKFDELSEKAFAEPIESDIDAVGAILQKHGIPGESPKLLFSAHQSVFACRHSEEYANKVASRIDHFSEQCSTNHNHHQAHMCTKNVENFRVERMFSVQSCVLRTNFHEYNFGKTSLSEELNVSAFENTVNLRHEAQKSSSTPYDKTNTSAFSMPLSCMSFATQNYLDRYGLLPDEITASNLNDDIPTVSETGSEVCKFNECGAQMKTKIWLFDERHRDQDLR